MKLYPHSKKSEAGTNLLHIYSETYEEIHGDGATRARTKRLARGVTICKFWKMSHRPGDVSVLPSRVVPRHDNEKSFRSIAKSEGGGGGTKTSLNNWKLSTRAERRENVYSCLVARKEKGGGMQNLGFNYGGHQKGRCKPLQVERKAGKKAKLQLCKIAIEKGRPGPRRIVAFSSKLIKG